MKHCSKCHEPKPESEFYFKNGRHVAACKICTTARQRAYSAGQGRERIKQYRQDNRDRRNKQRRDWYQNLKTAAFEAYGGRCACCGESEHWFLTFDHVEGGGMRQRIEDYGGERGRSGGHRFLLWLREHGYPPHIQVLCANCNMAKHFAPGGCPHARS